MKEKIEITIPLQEFSHIKYQDGENCYLATALKQSGYNDVRVSGFGSTNIANKHYVTVEEFNSEVIQIAFNKGESITVTLQEV